MNTTSLVTALGQQFSQDTLFGMINTMLPLIFTAFTVGMTVYLIRRILKKMGKFKIGF